MAVNPVIPSFYDTAVNLANDRPRAALELASHVGKWGANEVLGAHLELAVDSNCMVDASVDVLKFGAEAKDLAVKIYDWIRGAADTTCNQIGSALRTVSVRVGSFASNLGDTVNIAAKVGAMAAMPQVRIVGHVGGIFAKCSQILTQVGKYNELTAAGATEVNNLKQNQIMCDIALRVAIITIKSLSLAVLTATAVVCTQTFLWTSTAILTFEIAEFIYSQAVARAEA